MIRDLLNRFRRKPPAAAPSQPRGRLPKGSIAGPALAALMRPEPKDVGTLAAEMERDYQVQLAVLVLKANIQSVPITFKAEGDDPRLKVLTEQLKRLWQTHLASMLDCIGRGRVAFEKCWTYSVEQNLNYIEKLDALPFEHTEMRLGAKGQYEGIRLTIDKDNAIDIDAAKTWWLALDPTPLEPHGKSRYIGAPQEVWRERRETRERLAMFIGRFVVRGGVAYAPETETDEWGRVHDAMQITQELIENLYSGGSVVFPNVWQTTPGGGAHRAYEFTESPTTLDPTPLLSVIDAGDTAQLRSFGIPEKTLTEGDSVGSFAMVKQQTLALYAVIEGILSQCVSSFERYVIRPSIELNWLPENRVRIAMSYPKLTERPDSIVSQSVQQILSAGQTNELLASGAVDIVRLFQQAGIAVAPDAQQRLAAFVQQKQAAMASGPPRFDAGNTPGNPSSVRDLAVPVNAGPVPECPSREALADAVLAEVARLYAEMYAKIEARAWDDVWPIFDAIRELDAQAAFASRVLGIISPWQPSLIDKPAGAGVTQEAVKTLANHSPDVGNMVRDLAIVQPTAAPAGSGGPGWHFPWLQAALDWLRRKQVMTATELQSVAAAERTRVFSAPGIDDRQWLNDLKMRVGTSVREGRTLDDFREDVDQTLGSRGLSKPQMETIFRTNTHQAFIAGWGSITTQPLVKVEFGYVMLVATHDLRCRPTHAMMDGFVCSVEDPAYRLLMRLLSDYNCRCMTISLTMEQAQPRGIKTIADVPPEVLEKYG